MRVLNEQVTVNAPLSVVWDVLADFGRVDEWAPYMRTCHLIGERSSGVGTRRAMRHAWGFRFEEVINEWDEHRRIAFAVLSAPYPMNNVQETWILDSGGDGVCVRSRVTYDMRLGPFGLVLDGALVRFIVKREMRSGLAGLKRYIEARSAQAVATGLD